MKTTLWEKKKKEGKDGHQKDSSFKERALVLRRKGPNQTAYESSWKDKEKAKTLYEQSDDQKYSMIPDFIQKNKAKLHQKKTSRSNDSSGSHGDGGGDGGSSSGSQQVLNTLFLARYILL